MIYDPESGKPIDLSAADTVDGEWIEIDKELASKSPQFNPRLRVKDKKIITIQLKFDKQKKDCATPLRFMLQKNGKYVTDTYNMLIMSNQGNSWNVRNS